MTTDILIAGGGPGGCAAALALRRHAPSLAVAVVTAPETEGERLGEALPGLGRRLLDHLGVGPRFDAQGHRPAFGTAAVWGGPALTTHDTVFTTGGPGWHLDRARFDAMLLHAAAQAGATVVRARVRGVQRNEAGWRLQTDGGDAVPARFLIDATGRAAVVARGMGATVRRLDRLVGIARFFDGVKPVDPRTLVEAAPDGWWYTSGLPAGRRAVVFMTDADLARDHAQPDAWERALAETAAVRRTVEGAASAGGLHVRPTESGRLDRAAGDGWLAVGDAAAMVDPLSSQGITRALQSGTFGAYAAADVLLREQPDSLDRYARFIADAFDAYAETRARYYAAEQRWADRPFWRRRHAGAVVTA